MYLRRIICVHKETIGGFCTKKSVLAKGKAVQTAFSFFRITTEVHIYATGPKFPLVPYIQASDVITMFVFTVKQQAAC
jgi:hypothetical protein